MSTTRRSWAAFAAFALTAALVLPGCSSSSDPDAPADGAPAYQDPRALVLDSRQLARVVDGLPRSSAQLPLLRDGKVTMDELARSWKRLRSCLEDGGLTVTGPYLNPITGTDYLYTYARRGARDGPEAQDDAVDSTAHQCQEAYWVPISQVYSANTPQHLDGRLAAYLADCMTRADEVTARPATFDDLVRDDAGHVDPERQRRAYDCLDTGMPALFPQLPYFPRP